MTLVRLNDEGGVDYAIRSKETGLYARLPAQPGVLGCEWVADDWDAQTWETADDLLDAALGAGLASTSPDPRSMSFAEYAALDESEISTVLQDGLEIVELPWRNEEDLE